MNRPESPSTTLIVWFYVVLTVVVLGCSHYLGSNKPSQQQEDEDTAAAVADGEQASSDLHADYLRVLQREQAAKPDLWTPEQIARGIKAAGIAAQHQGGMR